MNGWMKHHSHHSLSSHQLINTFSHKARGFKPIHKHLNTQKEELCAASPVSRIPSGSAKSRALLTSEELQASLQAGLRGLAKGCMVAYWGPHLTPGLGRHPCHRATTLNKNVICLLFESAMLCFMLIGHCLLSSLICWTVADRSFKDSAQCLIHPGVMWTRVRDSYQCQVGWFAALLGNTEERGKFLRIRISWLLQRNSWH